MLLRAIVCGCFFVLSSLQSSAQPLDSLKKRVETYPAEDSSLVADLYRIGYTVGKTDPAGAETWLKRGLEVANRIGYVKQNASFKQELGKVAAAAGDYDGAINQYFEALKEQEAVSDPMMTSYLYTNIANAYFQLKQYDICLEYHGKALELKKQHGKPGDVARTLLNMGNAHRRTKNLPQAAEHFELARKGFQEAADLKGLALCANNLGNVYADLGDKLRAMSNYREAHALFTQMGNPEGSAGTLLNIGLLQSELKQFNAAEKTLLDASARAEKIPDHAIVMEAQQLLADLYEVTARPDRALVHLKKFMALNDSIIEAKYRGTIEKQRIAHETEKKEQENLYLKDENGRKKTQIQLASSGVAIIGLFSILLFVMYRRQRQSNTMLRNLNTEILTLHDEVASQRNLLEEQNHRLEKLNSTKDRFFSIIAHDVRSPFFGLLGYIELLQRDVAKLGKEEIGDVANRMLRSGRVISDLFENLLAWSRLELEEVKAEAMPVSVTDVIQEIVILFELSISRKNLSVITAIPQDLILLTDLNMLSVIMRNLISNAIKFSKTGTVVEIVAENQDGRTTISVIDRGVGIAEEIIQQLNEGLPLQSQPGTGNEKGTGLGLLVCKQLSNRLGGDMHISSTKGQGTTVQISLAA